MEPPASLDADAIRNEKVKVLGTVRPIAIEDTVRGQYEGYRSTEGVAPGGNTVSIRDPAAEMGMPEEAIQDADIKAALEKFGDPKASPLKLTVDGDLIDYELKLE